MILFIQQELYIQLSKNSYNLLYFLKEDDSMRIEQLFYFTQIVKYGSINSASEKLYISQPALGAAIRALEKELGYPLFYRNSYGVTLTKFGEESYAIALDILNKHEEFSRIKYSFEHASIEDISGTLNIAVVKTLSLNILPRMVSIFAESTPKLTLSIIEQNSHESLKQVANRVCDLALITAAVEDQNLINFSKINPDFAIEPLWDEKLYLLVKSNSELAEKRSVSIADLKNYPLVINSFNHEDFSQSDGLKQLFIENPIIFKSNSFSLIEQYIVNSNAFSFCFINISKNAEQKFSKKISVLPLKENMTMRFYAVYNKNSSSIKQIEYFLNVLYGLDEISNKKLY